MDRYSSLDGLKAIAATCIVMIHVLSNLGVTLSFPALNSFINSFSIFTLLFMMVSAFGMCCGYYEKFKQGQVSLNKFYKKRYTRILPFFALMVAIDLVVNPSLTELYEAFADLTLAFGLLPNAGITVIGVGWFLGVVFVFYMIFPFFVFLLDNKKRAWFVFIVVILLHLLASTYFSRKELMVVPVAKWNIVYSFPFFFAGGLLFLYRKSIVEIVGRTKWLGPLLFGVVTVSYYALPKVQLFSELFFLSTFVLFAISFSDRKGIFNNSVVKFISEISMEIYLCHMLFFRVVEKLHFENYISNDDLLFVVSFVLTFSGALVFALIWKRVVEPRVLKILE